MKKRVAAAGGLGMAGLIAPLGLCVFWDLLRKKVDNADAVSTALAISTLGTIPKISGDPLAADRRASRRQLRQRLALSESVDSVAAMMLHRARRSGHQVIMVTSALAGEGKSTTACKLAESLARSGKQVAIVDFDLRRPRLDRYLNVNRGPGVTEVLQFEISLEDAIQTSERSNLSVLTAGEDCESLYESSTSAAMEKLFHDLRQNFDLVIVDASPVLPVVDARIIGTYCDGAVLTLVRDVSRLPAAARACEMLRAYGVTVLGAIVIGASPDFYRDSYQYENRKDGATSGSI